MPTRTQLSLGIMAWNEEDSICHTLESLLRQSVFGRLAAPGRTLFAFALANVAAAVPELRGGPLEEGVALLNGIVRETAQRHGAVLVEMYDHPAGGDRDLYSADLVHATARGHAVIAAATIRALSRQITAG